VRSTWGSLPTTYTFTGQRLDGDTGLSYYGAHYYDPALGRFVQADTIVPEPGNPQSLNRYAYVLNNPLKYTDPTGHDPLDAEWQEAFRAAHGRDPEWYDVLIRLFSIAFPDEWDWHAFYNDDGTYKQGSIEKVFRDARPQDRSWSDVPDALERLAGWYKTGEEGLFTRDVGSLFGGLKNRFEEQSTWAAISYEGNPAHVWVYVSQGNIPSFLVGVDKDANIHHWAWGVAMSELGPAGSAINVGREIVRFGTDLFRGRANPGNTWADMNMGNLGVALGVNYRLLGLQPDRMRSVWNKYMLYRWWP